MEQIQKAIITLKYFKKKANEKIEEEKLRVKGIDKQIENLQSKCKHDFECESVWYLNQCTCKICGIVEIW